MAHKVTRPGLKAQRLKHLNRSAPAQDQVRATLPQSKAQIGETLPHKVILASAGGGLRPKLWLDHIDRNHPAKAHRVMQRRMIGQARVQSRLFGGGGSS